MLKAIQRVAVVGAGTMGAGIAQVVALAGVRVTLQDISAQALEAGLQRALSSMDQGVARGKVTRRRRDRARELLAGDSDLAAAVAGAGLIIEAVPEKLQLKKTIVAALSPLCPDSTIVATNTSSLSIAAIAAAYREPAMVVGLHFFNPPHIMNLVEIVRSETTDPAVVAAVRRFVDRLGKTAIVARDTPGFATSRLGLALGLEAMRMVEQGVASAEDVDRAMELGYGHPMGPLRVSDLVGLDIRLSIAEILHRELGSEQFRPPDILRRLVREGKLGQKTGEGFHRWQGRRVAP